MLRITLLGSPHAVWQDRPLLLGRRQSRALLYRIAATGEAVPRDQLCFLLWPDEPDNAARRYLSVVLSHLKRALPVPAALVIKSDSVMLDPALAWVDAVQWSRACAAALRERRVELLQAAVEGYSGLFLDGFDLPDRPEFQAWLAGERQAIEWRFLHVLDALAETATAAGNRAAAIGAAVRYLSVDPLAEEQHRPLMRLYAAAGDRAAVERQWQQCVTALERELDVEPLPETYAVFQAVRDGRNPPVAQRSGPRLELHRADTQAAADAAPALDTPDRQRSTLPLAPNRLIGRKREVAAVSRMLAGGARLVRLTGPGGVGKTRLAIEIGHALRVHYADGVVWAALAPLHDASSVADAIAHACALPPDGNTPISGLRAWLRDKHVLLVIDNFEHLLPAAPLLAELLAAGERVQMVVTSRARLNLQGEHSLSIAPLPLPRLDALPPEAALAEQPAVALLLERAQQRAPGFTLSSANAADLAAICIRVDGLPLAIELAAARLTLLGTRQLLRRLDHRLALLAGGPRDLPPRQQTLRATIAWSCDLLPSRTQRVFAGLAIFAGGCTVEAAVAVCGAGGAALEVLADLEALIDHSLVTLAAGNTPRITLLETIREYAGERLEEGGEGETLGERQATYYRELAEVAEAGLLGPQAQRTLDQLEQEHHNLLRAWDWLLRHGDAVTLYRLTRPCFLFWFERGHWREGAEHLRRLLNQTAGDPSPARAAALVACATLLYRSGRMHEGMAYAVEGYDVAVRGNDPVIRAMAAMNLSQQAPDAEQRLRFGREAIAALRPTPQRVLLAAALSLRGDELRMRGELQEARVAYTESLALRQAVGDELGTVNPLGNLGRLALLEGDVAAAQRRFAACVALARRSGSRPAVADWLLRLGVAQVYQEQLVEGRATLEEALALARAVEHQHSVPNILAWLALLLARQGALEEARRALEQSLNAYASVFALAAETPARDTTYTERPDVLDALIAAAQVHTAGERAELAAVALGCAARLAAEQSWRIEPPLQVIAQRLEETANQSLDDADFRAWWTRGAMLGIPDVLALLTRRQG